MGTSVAARQNERIQRRHDRHETAREVYRDRALAQRRFDVAHRCLNRGWARAWSEARKDEVREVLVVLREFVASEGDRLGRFELGLQPTNYQQSGAAVKFTVSGFRLAVSFPTGQHLRLAVQADLSCSPNDETMRRLAVLTKALSAISYEDA